MKYRIKGLLAGAAMVVCGFGTGVSAQAADNLKMAAFGPGGSWYIYATVISQIAQKALPEGSIVEVLPFAGGVGNPKLVNRGEADLGLSFSALSNWAYNGIVAFDTPHKEVRALFGGLNNPHRLGIAVRKDSGINSLADLKNVKARMVTVAVGGAGEALARMALESYGLTYDDIIKNGGRVTHIDQAVAMQQLRDGQADITIHNVGYHQPNWIELALSGDIKFIGLGEEQMDMIVKKYGLMPGLKIEAGEFNGVEADLPSIGYPTGVIANAKMSDDTAYAITKAVMESVDEIHEAHASLRDFDPKMAGTAARNGNIPLHPGAERYFKEQGWIK